MTRAWQVHEYGEPGSVLTLGNVPDLNPGDGQVRVRVAATSCNFADVLLCRGQYQHKPVPPFTPGLETCGIIDSLGEGVDPILLGTRIVGQPTLPHGGFAETALMNAADTYSVPGLIDDSTAATLHLTYLTAFLGLHRRAAMRAGDTVVVTAAAGGVGSAAVQIARAAGARVIGIVSGADKADAAARMGADTVIDRKSEDVLERVRAAAPDGADIVFDSAGGHAYELATKYIAFEGRIVVVGFASGSTPQPRLNHALVKNYTITGLHWSLYQRYRPDLVQEAQAAIFDMAAAGTIEPLITARVDLDAVPAALEDLAHGRTQGKIVCTL
ncbi:NADPH:quinone oxidoreductase family protein [Rhodococcus sp. USK10]|uniref:NADPH:quinone oxidoreductase family protein n=1 Tax=Rhodococcus sp. USK10 TaxID=2789739 RepID=UPI001C60085A|nr:NADPH:quinone oxidoreductase family protein [Rhodococcus sp. USK10]QYB00820.1 NADPH:quinone oxidoreductase family protein [Rhodococcus sp. USK10]